MEQVPVRIVELSGQQCCRRWDHMEWVHCLTSELEVLFVGVVNLK